MKKTTNICPLPAALLCGGLILTGCEGDGANLPSGENLEPSPHARFDPAAGIIPFPNNLLFNGSDDGTLNIPVANETDYSDPRVAMNALDGFSTLTPMTAQMSAPVDRDSIIPGDTVRVYQVNLSAAGAVIGVTRELAGVEYTAGVSPLDGSTVVITPLAPLAPSTGYLVTLSNGLKTTAGRSYKSELYYALAESTSPLIDVNGTSLYKGLTDEEAQKLEPLRQLTNAAEGAVEGYTISADSAGSIEDQAASDIILSWSFKTQSIGATLYELAGRTPETLQILSTDKTTADANPAFAGIADIYAGSVSVPYYSSAPSTDNPTAPLSGFWHTDQGGFVTAYSPVPKATGTETIPVLMTLPNSTSTHSMPAAGWPVVIFQHGITQNRTNLLAIADTLAQAGFAGIAIDLPLHGITDSTNPFYVNGSAGAHERTFDMDLINNETQLPGPDSVTDPSGIHFINLANLLNTRDNVRQAVADLMTLTVSLDGMTVDGATGIIDSSKVYYVGHSLGAMVALPFLAQMPQVDAAVLGFPGGGIAKLLDGSVEFGPKIAAGLSAKGVLRGTQDYESFMMAAQTVMDTADPINYATSAVTGRGVLLFEVVGDGNTSLPDQVVPNNVTADAPEGVIVSPTAGTDPLARAMTLIQYSQTPSGSGTPLNAWVRFTAGHHGSMVTPQDAAGAYEAGSLSDLVFQEIQGEMASFLLNGGTALTIDATQGVIQ